MLMNFRDASHIPLLVYGTLREGCKLHDYYLDTGCYKLNTVRIPGVLWTTKRMQFPIASVHKRYGVAAKPFSPTFVVEKWAVHRDNFFAIYRMETSTGLYECRFYPEHKAFIFAGDNAGLGWVENLDESFVVRGGDWAGYENNN